MKNRNKRRPAPVAAAAGPQKDRQKSGDAEIYHKPVTQSTAEESAEARKNAYAAAAREETLTAPVEAVKTNDPITPDRFEAERFLKALDPTAIEFTFQTFDDNTERKETGTEKKELVRILHGTLDRHFDTLAQLNAAGAGIFVTINATDLMGRKKKNIIRVRSLFADFDNYGPLPHFEMKPHIVVSSSPGKWHVYWRVTDVEIEAFTDHQVALAAQFDTDSSVKDVSRVMRVPGFLHRKVEETMTMVRVVETNDLEPYAASAFPVGDEAEIEVEIDAALVEWPAGRGTADERPDLNSLAFSHLDRWVPALFGPAAVYQSGTGAYRISSKALGRDLQEDLSVHPDGIKDFGVHDIGDACEGNRTPITIVMKYANKDFAAAEAWLKEKLEPVMEAEGMALKESVGLDDFYAYMPMHNYLFIPARDHWPGASVNARIRPIPILDADGNPQRDADGKVKKIKATAWLDQNQPVEQMTWAPGLPMLISDRLISDGGWIERHGMSCFNLYCEPTVKLGDADQARPWVNLIRKVYPDDADHIIRWFAHRVQYPGVKINHAIVLGGDPGIGKDTLLEPVKEAVGSWNFHTVSPKAILGSFNGFLKSTVMRINEARDLGDISRYEFYDAMKAYTAAPPDVLRVNEKNLREYYIFNCVGVVITTNYKDALYLPPDDRRTYVTWSKSVKDDFTDDYWIQMWRWYHSEGFGHVAAYLATLDISSFNAKAPPPKTSAFWTVVDINRPAEDAELSDRIDTLGERDSNNPEVLKLPDVLTLKMISSPNSDHPSDLSNWLKDRRNRRNIIHRLERCGYVPVRNPNAKDGYWKIGDTRQVVYAKSELTPSAQFAAVTKFMNNLTPM